MKSETLTVRFVIREFTRTTLLSFLVLRYSIPVFFSRLQIESIELLSVTIVFTALTFAVLGILYGCWRAITESEMDLERGQQKNVDGDATASIRPDPYPEDTKQ